MRLPRIITEFTRRRSLRDLVRGLSFRELLPLLIAIFTLFAVLGTMTDVMRGARQPLPELLATCVFSGAVAIAYAYGSLQGRWYLLAAAIALQLAWRPMSGAWFGGLPPLPPGDVPARLKFDGGLTLNLTAISYSCFIWFLNTTAGRYLRARAEIELAREIHHVLVPAVATTIADFEFAGFSIPSGDVGGDLVDVVPLTWLSPPDGGEMWFGYVADVSGHGVSSGVVMGMFKSALRMWLRKGGTLSAMLADLNVVLLPLKSSSMFVTAACVRGARGGSIEYTVAGHLPILHVRAGARQAAELTTPQIPIGMFEAFDYTSAACTCDRGDLLALITDGLTEVFDARDRELGLERVKEILVDSAARPLRDIADQIVAAARSHGPQIDDQTLLLIRRL